MDKKTFTIGILSLSAVILFAANLLIPLPRATAQQVIKDRDYQVLTARLQPNDDGLYILENRTGNMAVFSYDPSTKSFQARAVRPIMDAFPTGGFGAGGR